MVENHPSKTNVRAVVKPPKNYEVVCLNNKYLSVMTSDVHATINMIGPTREKSYEEVYYYVYLYEEFQNNFFVRKKYVSIEGGWKLR